MKRLALFTALLLLLAGCDTSAPVEENLALGTLTAKLNGEQFTSIVAVAQPCFGCEAVGREGIKVAGIDSEGRAVGFVLVDFNGEGTYPFSDGSEVGSGGVVDNVNGESFATDWPGGSGSVEVTRNTDSAIEGTFSFTALNGPEGESIRVTDGRFNVPFQNIP